MGLNDRVALEESARHALGSADHSKAALARGVLNLLATITALSKQREDFKAASIKAVDVAILITGKLEAAEAHVAALSAEKETRWNDLKRVEAENDRLAADVQRLTDALTDLRKALKDYGQHKWNCGVRQTLPGGIPSVHTGNCTCGFNELDAVAAAGRPR